MPKVPENPRLPAVRRGDFGERTLACFHAAELSARRRDVIPRYYGIGRIDRGGGARQLKKHRRRSSGERIMFAVIFEVNPKAEQWDTYLSYAGMLRPELEQIDGFIDNERFSSLRRPGWVLSLSIWRDEKAVIRWRTSRRHHEIQQKGRAHVFCDYHLRVGEITADSRVPNGQSLTEQRFDATAASAKLVDLWEAAPEGLPAEPDSATVAARLGMADQAAYPGLVDWDAFESIYQRGKFVLLTSWRDRAAAGAWPVAALAEKVRHRRVRVIRDYGMFDRAEAPQYYPPLPREGPGS